MYKVQRILMSDEGIELGARESPWVAGKTCLITGANSGIGKATATGLLRMGARVVIVCRDPAKGAVARSEIVEASGSKSGAVRLMTADLSSLASVRKLAANFLQTNEPLHVLVNDAGVILGKRSVTMDGFETTFQVNYLSHFLLTGLLLGSLKASAPSRIINVSSDAHTGGHMDFDDLQEEKRYSALRSYSQSKLAQILFTFELAKRLRDVGVTVNAVHPGAVASNWGTHSVGLFSIGVKLAHPFMIGPEKGADTVVYLASSSEVSGVTGKYFTKRKAVPSSKESTDDAEAKRLWEVSLKLAKLENDPTLR